MDAGQKDRADRNRESNLGRSERAVVSALGGQAIVVKKQILAFAEEIRSGRAAHPKHLPRIGCSSLRSKGGKAWCPRACPERSRRRSLLAGVPGDRSSLL